MSNYNREFKTIDSNNKAYVLGMFYADGCISANNSVRISLCDNQIIKDMLHEFPFFNDGEFDFSKYNQNNKMQYYLQIKNNDLQNDLINLGMLFRKSTENATNLKMPTIEQQYISHFIRGYFDGNGSISIPSARPNLRRVEICSSSKTLIEGLKNSLESFNILCPIYRNKKNTNSTLYILEWVSIQDIKALEKFLYKDSYLKLDRKFDLFDSLERIVKIESNPLCNNCNNYLRKNGKRQMANELMIRYKCPNCNKNYSFPF